MNSFFPLLANASSTVDCVAVSRFGLCVEEEEPVVSCPVDPNVRSRPSTRDFPLRSQRSSNGLDTSCPHQSYLIQPSWIPPRAARVLSLKLCVNVGKLLPDATET